MNEQQITEALSLFNSNAHKIMSHHGAPGDAPNRNPPHGVWLSALSHVQKPKVFLEIGSRYGLTAFYVIQGMSIDEDSLFISVDLDYHRPREAPPSLGFSQNKKYFRDIRLKEYWGKTSNDSYPAVKKYCQDSCIQVDFLLIDGCHTYEGVKSDFLNYTNLLSKTGIVVLDDISSQAGVRKFYTEHIKNNFKTIESSSSDMCVVYDIG